MTRFSLDRRAMRAARIVLPASRMAPSRLAMVLGLVATTAIAAAQPAPDDADAPAEPPAADPLPGPPSTSADELAALRARLDALEAAAREPASPRSPVEDAGQLVPIADWRDSLVGLRFGSYGRVGAGTDLNGGKAEPVHVVAHGPRIVEPSYLELDFGYGVKWGERGLIRTVITLAYDDQLFHDTGDFTAGPAIRNLYVEARNDGHTIWAGSRMLRGDDLYLFDYWPLDDLNTVGAGGQLDLGRSGFLDTRWLEVAAHVGVNRLLDPFQYQERPVADPELGATTVVQLNRQRMIASARASYVRTDAQSWLGIKVTGYGELHGLPSGTRRRADASLEALPSDWGLTVGAQVSAWNTASPGWVRAASLFVRYARGLAAFDELAAPTSFDAELRTFPKASEFVLGAGLNWDAEAYHVTGAAYARRFVDADVNVTDRDDGWEYAIDLRPAVRVHDHGVYLGADLAYEARFPRGLQPTTQLAADAGILSIAPMVSFHPTGRSAFDRPELRLIYRAAHQNDGALALYPSGDPRARTWTHFLGVEAEWWFNSNSYR